MKTPYELINKISTVLYHKYKKDPAEMLIHTGTIGWTLSAAAQIGAVLINDEIPKDQKRFLIPQEIFDAGINIVTFYAFTNSCNVITKKLIKSGKLASKPIREFIKTKVNPELVGKFDTDLEKIIEKVPTSSEISGKYKSFSDGVTMAVNLAASVVAGNILTPILRNQIGAKVQKKLIERKEAKMDEVQKKQLNPVVPILPAQNKLGIDAYSKRVSSNPYSSSSSMKI